MPMRDCLRIVHCVAAVIVEILGFVSFVDLTEWLLRKM